jgi:hypothetical protein
MTKITLLEINNNNKKNHQTHCSCHGSSPTYLIKQGTIYKNVMASDLAWLAKVIKPSGKFLNLTTNENHVLVFVFHFLLFCSFLISRV